MGEPYWGRFDAKSYWEWFVRGKKKHYREINRKNGRLIQICIRCKKTKIPVLLEKKVCPECLAILRVGIFS